MLASIIITNYNYSKYLGNCLRSCINQSINPDKYEIILIDDFSKDNSLEIAQKYLSSFKNFKIIKNKKNLGVAKSSNIAIKSAKGKYVIRVDSDDYINKEFLNILVYFLEEHPDYFSVACDYYLVNNKGEKIKRVSSRDNPVSCGVLYNKKYLMKIGMYDSKYRHREEEELRSRIDLNPNLLSYYLNFPLYRYRMHESNKTKQKNYSTTFRKKIDKIILSKNFREFSKRERDLTKNIIVVIPAREGSKRLPNKNMYKIWGKPMIYWPIKAAKKSKYVKSIYVTSDSKKILNYSSSLKVKTILRPINLSDDKTEKMKAIAHATKLIMKKTKPTLVVSLQANSPDVKTFDIDKCVEKLVRFNLNEVISTDENFNQNGTIRVLKQKQVFFDGLSTHCGFVVTNTSDIHFLNDLKKTEKTKSHANK